MKTRFQDITMQMFYERLIKKGLHWKRADRETRERFDEYDGVEK